jgi:hypothetical protein
MGLVSPSVSHKVTKPRRGQAPQGGWQTHKLFRSYCESHGLWGLAWCEQDHGHSFSCTDLAPDILGSAGSWAGMSGCRHPRLWSQHESCREWSTSHVSGFWIPKSWCPCP